MDDIYDLDQDIQDAIESLTSAINRAETIHIETTCSGESPEGEPIYNGKGWTELKDLAENLKRIKVEIEVAVKPMEQAFKDVDAYYSHLDAMADAVSY